MEPIGHSMSAPFSKKYRACPLEAVAIEISYRRITALAFDSLGCPKASSSGNIKSDNRILIRKKTKKKTERALKFSAFYDAMNENLCSATLASASGWRSSATACSLDT